MDSLEIESRFIGVAKSQTFRNIINEFGLNKCSVLDIGCTYGEFLKFFGPNSLGVTIVDEETKYAKSQGLNVITGNIEDPKFKLGQKFDFIFANNIFEHLYSPHHFLIKIKANLNPNGVLILGVPCIPKIVLLLRFKKFRGSLASNHINYFTRDTLLKTVQSGGWQVEECRSFHFKNKLIDQLVNWVVPHFYVIARPKQNFKYPAKRQKEVDGYQGTDYGQ